jgi:hypothetical protein
MRTLDDFIYRFREIKNMGWVRTHRAGPTGIGKTLEVLLGIPENNISGPDFGEYELKSARLNSNSMLTLFTRNPQPRGSNSRLRSTYGYLSEEYDNSEKVLHSTLNARRFTSIANTGHELKIVFEDGKIYVASETGIESAHWEDRHLQNVFNKKYKGHFIYALAQNRGEGQNEEFYFESAFIVSGFDYNNFASLLEQGGIVVDIRMGQYASGKPHDHGTAFRIRPADIMLLFKEREQIV